MKNYFSINSKKGAVTSVISDFWAYVAFVLVVIIFYGLFTFAAKNIKENKIIDLETNTKADLNLINYLRTPVEVVIDREKRQMIMADLIVLTELEPEGENRGKLALGKSHEILDSTLGENKWAINVCYQTAKSRTEKCWLYFNLNRWEATIKGQDGNLLGESYITIPNLENGQVQVWMRILK